MFNKEELGYLEEIINEAIKDYLNSGYPLTDEYVITLRGMLEKLGLKEIYRFDRDWNDDEDLSVLKPKNIIQARVEREHREGIPLDDEGIPIDNFNVKIVKEKEVVE